MLQGVENMIWNNEFRRFKSKEDRESIRREYDGAQAKLSIIEAQILAFPEDKTKWTDDQKRVEDAKALLVRDIEGELNGDGTVARPGYKHKMRDLDLEIHGSPKTNEFPDGVEGIDQQIEGLRQLQALTKRYIKTL